MGARRMFFRGGQVVSRGPRHSRVLEEGLRAPTHQLAGLDEHCKLPSWVWGTASGVDPQEKVGGPDRRPNESPSHSSPSFPFPSPPSPALRSRPC